MTTACVETSVDTDSPPQLAPCPVPYVRSAGRTDVGRVRAMNQDQFLVAELARTMWVHQSSLPQPDIQHGNHHSHIFLVADGMGGHAAGEVASELTVKSIESFILNVLTRFSNLKAAEDEQIAQDFRGALQLAHARLLREAIENPEVAGMGTTLTMAFTSNWKLFVVHAGDCRCYLFRNQELKQITSDHTIVGELIRRGVIKPEQAAQNLFRHVVTNAVGVSKDTIRVDVERVDLQPDDVLLLCSDGLTDMLANDRIATILGTEPDPRLACDRLVNEALEAGGRDNVTAIVARFEAFWVM